MDTGLAEYPPRPRWPPRRTIAPLRGVTPALGMTKPNISRLENGHQKPYPKTVRRLAEALGVAPEELVDWGAGAEGETTEQGKAAA